MDFGFALQTCREQAHFQASKLALEEFLRNGAKH